MRIQSIAEGTANDGDIWALDGSRDELLLLHADGSFEIAAKSVGPGVLLPDPDGVLHMSSNGKRYLITVETTAVYGWVEY